MNWYNKILDIIRYKKIKKSNIISDIMFGLLLLIDFNAIGSCMRIMVASLKGGMVKVVDENSPSWCERSQYAISQCYQYEIYFFLSMVILAAVLYHKYKKIAFVCLIFPLFFDINWLIF